MEKIIDEAKRSKDIWRLEHISKTAENKVWYDYAHDGETSYIIFKFKLAMF